MKFKFKRPTKEKNKEAEEKKELIKAMQDEEKKAAHKKKTVLDRFRASRKQDHKKKRHKKSKIEKEREKQRKRIRRRHLLRETLIRAGVDAKPESVSRWVFRSSVVVNVFVALFLIWRFAPFIKLNFFIIPLIVIVLWIAIFAAVFFIMWFVLYLALDLLTYKRKVGVEAVLADYLLLASANIRAGMPIDRALWFAVRPRFGVLAKEIEIVAKETMSGEDLEGALQKFARKYDSIQLKNTVSLIIEGVNAGGEMAELLSTISEGLQDSKLLRKEMAAGISAYAIFITVSAIVMAPLLYALSSQLLSVIGEITSNIDIPDAGAPTLAFAGGGVGVSQGDFLIFAYTNLFFTSLLSAMIVSIIRKGNVRDGLKLIPMYVLFSMAFFFLAFKGFSSVFGNII